MSKFVSVIFCRNCSSRYVEIDEWNDKEKKVILHCRTCDIRETVENFTLGRCEILNSAFQDAVDTRAIPYKPER